jgi:hypothetical protein
MKKNVANQVAGADLVTIADGSAFTGTATCYVTVDNGTQTIGSVGSGAATSKGNGYYTYLPSQAETNGDHLAFTFIGTGAVTRTVQYDVNFPQSADVGAGVALSASQHVIVDSGTVTMVTNDVGITQSGADKVWNSAARTLTSFGTLVADAATAVWAAANRTLTALGFVSSDTPGTTTLLNRIPTFPANFSTLGITLDGKISDVVLTGTVTTYTGNTPQSGDAYDRIGANGAGLTGVTGVTFAANQHVVADTLGTLPAPPTDWLSGGSVSLTAVAKLQNGLATPTNITSGTIGLTTDYDAAKTAAQELTLTAMKGTNFDTATDTLHQIRLNAGSISATDIRTALGLATANLDAQLAAKPALAAIVTGILDALVADHQVTGSFAKAVGDAALLGDPWTKQFLVPGSDPPEYVTAGELLFQLFIAPYIQSIAPTGAPDDITMCRVTGRFELPDGTWANKVPVQFDLVVPGGGPAKSDNIIVQVQIVTSTDTQGYLVYKGRQWVDLERNDFITPAGTSWTVTSESLGFDATPFELVERTFNLGTLIV